MEYLKIDGEFPRLSKSAVTLGKFDGIHRGHQKLVEKILEQKEKGLQTVLFSLGIGSQMIFTKEERCQLLEKAGVDVLIECPLDNRIRHMKAEILVKETWWEMFRRSMLQWEKISGSGMNAREHHSFWRLWEGSLALLWMLFRKKWKAAERSAVHLSVRN